MSNYSWEQFDEIFDLDQKSLVSLAKERMHGCRVEITLNHPQTKPWQRLGIEKQTIALLLLYNQLKLKYPTALIHDEHHIEHYQSGLPHLHAVMIFSFPHVICAAGLVEELAKLWLNELPKRYSSFDVKNYHIRYQRYRCPSCVINYYDLMPELFDNNREIYWQKYITKNCT